MPDGTFGVKFLHNNNFKINAQTDEMYRNMTELLSEDKYIWDSYENKQSRPIRIMAKRLQKLCRWKKHCDDLVL